MVVGDFLPVDCPNWSFEEESLAAEQVINDGFIDWEAWVRYDPLPLAFLALFACHVDPSVWRLRCVEGRVFEEGFGKVLSDELKGKIGRVWLWLDGVLPSGGSLGALVAVWPDCPVDVRLPFGLVRAVDGVSSAVLVPVPASPFLLLDDLACQLARVSNSVRPDDYFAVAKHQSSWLGFLRQAAMEGVLDVFDPVTGLRLSVACLGRGHGLFSSVQAVNAWLEVCGHACRLPVSGVDAPPVAGGGDKPDIYQVRLASFERWFSAAGHPDLSKYTVESLFNIVSNQDVCWSGLSLASFRRSFWQKYAKDNGVLLKAGRRSL